MQLSAQNNFQATKRTRFILPFFLLFLVICDVAAGVRKVEISRFVQPTSTRGKSFFRVQGRYAGGVVPRGTAEFLSPGKVKLNARQLKLVVIDKDKLRNDKSDYDAIGLQWKGGIYQLSTQDDLIYPLMKFVLRGSYIAFTYPFISYDPGYFKKNALVPYKKRILLGMSYVAKEFSSDRHAEFLDNVDLIEDADEMPANLKARIIKQANTGMGEFADYGTHVNADFHVKYQVFLDNVDGNKVADVGGLPLRYHWDAATGGSVIVHDVEVFKFPEDEFGLQYRAVLFFQTAAILRQFKQDNRPEFDRFLKEVSNIIGEQ